MSGVHNRQFENFNLFRKLNFSSLMPNISHGEFAALMAVKHCGQENTDEGVRICMLAEKLHVVAPAVSRTIRSLEEKEFVIRTIDEKDRRNIFVQLTVKGEAVLSETEAIMNDFAGAVIDKIGSENMDKLNYYLKQLYEVSKEELALRKKDDRKEDTDYGQDI